MIASPIPSGYHTITAYQVVKGADRLLEFVVSAFDAIESERMMRPDGTVGHAEVKIGDSVLMVSEASSEWPPMPAAMYLYVADCDATYQCAIEACGVSISSPATHFYGDRSAAVRGPVGDLWWRHSGGRRIHRRAEKARRGVHQMRCLQVGPH